MTPPPLPPLPPGRLNIAITCFPTFGGSGIVATEIGLAMASRGHRVHFVARDLPVRLGRCVPNVLFHEVSESDYPALHHSGTYAIALASKLVEVAGYEPLDVLHVHYAVPHATAAWMASEVLGPASPAIVTTLHGTDITLVGADPGYLPITRLSILKSHAVTAPSEFLRAATHERLHIDPLFPIDVIPNFVDTARYAPDRADRARLDALFPAAPSSDPVLFHVSNFRPVKRVCDVLRIFQRLHEQHPSRLVLIGDGPERSPAERRIRELGLADRVAFLGKQDTFAPLLAASDAFLLPSETESFGLAALEALSCGVPVIASDVGGLPEVVDHGQTGYLAPVGDVAAFAGYTLDLLTRPDRRATFGALARARVLERYQLDPAIDRYERLYRRVTAGRRAP